MKETRYRVFYSACWQFSPFLEAVSSQDESEGVEGGKEAEEELWRSHCKRQWERKQTKRLICSTKRDR